MDDKHIACIKHREFGFGAQAKILSFWNSVHGSNRHRQQEIIDSNRRGMLCFLKCYNM